MGSIGSSKGSSKGMSSSQSDMYGYNQSGQQASSAQNVWGAQGGALGDLYAQAQSLMGGGSPYGQAGAAVGQAGTQAWQGQLTPGSNPYFDQAVQASIDQASDSFRRQVLPELDARSAGAGQLGSSRDRLATGEAAGLFGQSVAQTAAQQRAEQYSGDQNRVMQAIGMTPMMQQGAYGPLSVAASLIGGPTVLNQAQSSGFGQGENFGHTESMGTQSSKQRGFNMGVLSKSNS